MAKKNPFSVGDSPVLGDVGSILEAWDNFDPGTALFYSSTETNGSQTNAHIPNTNTGYFDGAEGSREFYKLGQSASTIGTQGNLIASPYSTRLRPVSQTSGFEGYPRIYITRVEFRAYDVSKEGVAEQNADVLAEIEASAGTINDAYIQSRYLGGEVGGWQPNFFRPKISAGGRTLFAEAQGSNFGYNLGDMSIGFPLPYIFVPPIPISIGKFSSSGIKVWASAGQVVMVDDVPMIQRFPVSCYLELLLSKR